jgi:hypothetical protein
LVVQRAQFVDWERGVVVLMKGHGVESGAALHRRQRCSMTRQIEHLLVLLRHTRAAVCQTRRRGVARLFTFGNRAD